MPEYIDREDYCKNLCHCHNEYCDKESCPIWRAPAADVAPVVRCENCTSGIMSDDNKYIICCRLGVGMELDGFCSHGERKIT